MQPVFRFAPSPNGALHLGHALSALINFEAAKRCGGRFLLRLEDIDTTRCTDKKTDQVLEDLNWLGLEWEEPVLRQSTHFPRYDKALELLKNRALIHPSSASRREIEEAVQNWENKTGNKWPNDPDGALLYPRQLLGCTSKAKSDIAWRLDMKKAVNSVKEELFWQETGPFCKTQNLPCFIKADPAQWGDVILARKDIPTSYHLSVVLDDAIQGITHIIRGQDLYHATAIHRLLQALLDLPEPTYHHHRLLTNTHGQKLSKSRQDLSIRALRESGTSPQEIRALVHLSEDDFKGLPTSS